MAALDKDDDEMSSTSKTLYVRAAHKSRTWHTTSAELATFFEACGKPRAILNKWGEEPADGNLREIAFVSFKKNKALQKALAMSGQSLSDRALVIGINTRPLERKKQPTSSIRVFVGNLPLTADDAAVRALFDSCGKILFVRFAVDADGTPRGFCHVVFEDADGSGKAAHHAIAMAENSNVEMDGRQLNVAAAIEKPHEPRAPGKPRRERSAGGGAPDDADAVVEKKKMRPSEWRIDRSAGLTMPSPHKYGVKGGRGKGEGGKGAGGKGEGRGGGRGGWGGGGRGGGEGGWDEV